MDSIKVKFRPSAVSDNEGSIYYQITHDRKIRQISSDYHIFNTEWNSHQSMIFICSGNERNSILLSIRDNIRKDVDRLTKIIRALDNTRLSYTVDDIIDEFNRFKYDYTLFNFIEHIIEKLKTKGNIRTSETYRATLNSFKKFRSGKDIMIDCLTSEIMESYEIWLKNRGVTQNTISFYARILRAVYNRVLEQNIIENKYPFRHIYTGVDKTVKRALPLNVLKRIKDLDLHIGSPANFARDMFLMSFYLRGMSFIDMAFLRKTDLKNGYLTYRRHKTGQQLIIKWTNEMQDILNKYPKSSNKYLLPIIRGNAINERCTYRNANYNINRNLKIIAKMTGIKIPLTLYVARHSWASVARAKGIPLSVISEGMGHDSESTTKIYLASLDTSAVDKANSIILKSL